MKINKQTMLFEDISDDEAREMLYFCKDIVLYGKVSFPDYFEQWIKEFKYDERQKTLLISTAFPQRVLLSLVLNYFY